jgi:hypothetical protein
MTRQSSRSAHQPGRRHPRRSRSKVQNLKSKIGGRFRPRLELVEDRTLLSTFVVNSTADSGPGSLRQAILDSNAAIGQVNTINFDIPGQGVQTIAPLSSLPTITQAVLIDGSSQPGYPGTPLIELNGGQLSTSDGLTITGSHVTVRGLDIDDFSQGAGIHITGTSATGDWIYANFFGMDPTGTQAGPNDYGVEIDGGATKNLIGTNGDGVNDAAERNVLSGNLFAGVWINGQGTDANAVAGNFIGTDVSGAVALDNGTQTVSDPSLYLDTFGGGVVIENGASGNRIGTDGQSVDDRGERNVIGGSGNDGVDIAYSGTTGNVVAGNFIGTDVTGTVALGVAGDGVFIAAGASSNWIGVNPNGGTAVADEGNVISGTGYAGVQVSDTSNSNDVAGNKIGTDVTGTVALANSSDGVELDAPAADNTIGGTASGSGNVISANRRCGVLISGAGATGNLLQGNMLGTDITGTIALGNGQSGVAIAGAANNTVGGATAAAGNVITNNTGTGVDVTGSDSLGDRITNNRIFENGGQAIDLGNDGVTYNSTSPRSGPNNEQNFPVIVTTADGKLQGWLGGSTPDAAFRIDVFASASYGPRGAGEAEDYLGSLVVTTDSRGQVIFDVPFTPPASLPILTATATDTQGNTSEVSAVRKAAIQTPTQTLRVPPGQPTIFSSAMGDGISLQDPEAGPTDPAWNVTLSVSSGTLTLSRTAGLSGSGNGTGTLQYRGPLSALEAALEGLRYTPSPQSPISNAVSLQAQSQGAPPLQGQVQLEITDGVFLVTTSADSGPGSLRQAILDSNTATGGPNTIDFAIPGAGVQTIAPSNPLPPITNSVRIDGTTQPGFVGSPLIALTGSSPGNSSPLVVSGGTLTMRGLAVDRVAIEATAVELLIAVVQAQGLPRRLSLLDAQGQVLDVSDGLSPTVPDDVIDRHLSAGTYFLKVQSTGSGGDYALTTTLAPASPPFQPFGTGTRSGTTGFGGPEFAVGDFNGDGIPDLATTCGVYLGLGDGTFRNPSGGLDLPDPNPRDYCAIVAGDFNGDGKLDLAMANYVTGSVLVLMGNGNGTFQPAGQYWAGNLPFSLVAGDFNGDGKLDLAVANDGVPLPFGNGPGGVSVLLGNGDGTFQPAHEYAAGASPTYLVTGDFTGDGHLDLAVANYDFLSGHGGVEFLLGNGDGTFQPPHEYRDGSPAIALAAGDYNGDGRLDLAVCQTSGLEILLNRGAGTFQSTILHNFGNNPSLVAGDFNGDGRLDLAVLDSSGSSISILVGTGDGNFQQVQGVPVSAASSLLAGDFNGDGRLDLAVGGFKSISVLLGNGDGTFAVPPQNVTGSGPAAVIAGDFNGDGRLDLAVADLGSNDVSVFLGNGDGTFQPAQQYATGSRPAAIVAGDFNGDGRLDLAVACVGDGPWVGPDAGGLSVLLGNGDGTFQPPKTYAAGTYPYSLVAGDFNGDGKLDLAVTDLGIAASAEGGGLDVLLGNGDGTFQRQVTYPVGSLPTAVVAGDFAGDGRIDLALTNSQSKTVSVLRGNGDGTFQPRVTYPVGQYPGAIVTGDFAGNGRIDLAVVDSAGVQLLMGNGDGTFQEAKTVAAGIGGPLAAGDFNGDGKLDLAVAVTAESINLSGSISVLLGNGDDTFQPESKSVALPLSSAPYSLVAADLNGDGRLDLVTANTYSKNVSVLLGNGDGTLADPGRLAITARATPLVADVNGDGTNDVLVVDGAGDILYRQGVPGQPGTFEPPVTVNPNNPSRDVTFIPRSSIGPLIASVDARDDHVSLYGYRNGGFVQIGSLNTGPLPAQIIAADLDHSGWMDLIVRNAGDGTLSVFFNDGRGTFHTGFGPSGPFLSPVTIPVGIGVSDVAAVDTTGAGIYDLVVTNKLTTQVSVLLNLGARTFAPPVPYRAGTGLSPIDPSGSPEVTSLEATSGVAAGPLTPGRSTDLLANNPGSNTMDLLRGLGGGRFANPVTIQTTSPAEVIRMADFTGNGIQDLAALTPAGLIIYLGNGNGGFLPHKTYAVPPEADGLTVADLLGNGKLDLLVGDAYGDVLVLLGNGDGTFQPYHESNQTIQLAVADLTGKGSKDIIYADQRLDRVVVDYGAGKSNVLANQSTGLLAPGAVTLADLNSDGIPDLIVANSGSNNVLVYPGLGNGQFGPAVNGGHGFFTGTNPVGITVANLTGNLPDLVVANKGSNDVSILLNQGNFSFTQGPRLRSGGSGPVSTVVGHFTGSPYPDILVTNSGSNNVALLPGVGSGFFNDTNPRTFAVGTDPGPLFVGNFDGNRDLVTVNTGSNDLTLISDFMSPDATTSTIASGGTDPATALAFTASSGFEDLVVGNGGDGALALFEGGPQGLSLSSTEFNPDLPSPSSLAFAGVAGGQVQFFAATEGREAAILVALSLTGASGSSTGSAAITPAIPENVAQLVPLQESSLALVGTLLVVTIESPAVELSETIGQTGTALASASASAASVALGQGGVARNSRGVDGNGEDNADQSGEPQTNSSSSTVSWERFVLGTDEALEQYEREHSKPSAPPARPAGTPETDPAGPHSDNQGPAPQDAPSAQSSTRREDRGVELIDAALGLLDDPRRVGETHQTETNQESNCMRIGLVGFTHPTKARHEERYDVSAALALAATVAGNLYFGWAGSRGKARRRWVRGSGISRLGNLFTET